MVERVRQREEREREGGRKQASKQAREGRERGGGCRAATLLVPLLLQQLEGCALKRRCAGCGPREPLLHPVH